MNAKKNLKQNKILNPIFIVKNLIIIKQFKNFVN